ncbi:MAG: DNA mismatch repair protein MutS [Chloroflexi bacterium]|nr:DNA mismatch repair protein MutS [Chloroflexota bacterium]
MAAPRFDAARPDGRETPIRRQYEQLKALYPNCILFFQLGDFFETFEDDARTVARVCGITLTSREFGKGDRVALAGVPVSRADHYLALLMEAGLHVAVAEQVSPPGKGLVERVVTRVVTPGTLAEPGLLREKENNYLAAILHGRGGIGLAYVDVTTGEFAATELTGDDAEVRLRTEIERLNPSEILEPEGQEIDLPRIGHRTICPSWHFSEAAARERLCAQLRVLSLEGFGAADHPFALRAAAAILHYLDENNRRLLPNLVDLRIYPASTGMTIDGATRRNLDLFRNSRTGRIDGSLLAVLDQTRTPMGGRLLRRWIGQPLRDRAMIEARLDAIASLVQHDDACIRLRNLLGQIGDLERLTGRIVQGLAGPRELLGLAAALRTAARLRDVLAGLSPTGTAGGDCATASLAVLLDRAGAPVFDPCLDIADLIDQAVAPPDSGTLIRPGYSAELDALVETAARARQRIVELERVERQRTGIKSLKVGYNKVFGYYLEVTRPNLRFVPSDYHRKQTLVQAERFVTPILKEWESEILQAEERIEQLAQEIYDGLLRRIAAEADRLRATASSLAHLDVLAALAHLARERGYCRPVVDESFDLEIVEGRHPVVEAHLAPGAFIPNDCRLGLPDQLLMILTGPNMAGKSTYLRQVALIVLMAQIGSFVPARSARIGLVDRIFTRVGAQDDIAAGASTFLVEMMETASILRHATPRSLIILDEIGRGTSTFDGLSIARAVVEEIRERVGARTLFATHFHELASWASTLPGVGVFNMAVREEGGEVIFLRTVVAGVADRSYGIQVARLAGLPDRVTRRAAEILRELEAPGTATAGGETERSSLLPVQIPLPGLGLSPESPIDLLNELLALDPAELTPLEALNRIWEIQRRAGRR